MAKAYLEPSEIEKLEEAAQYLVAISPWMSRLRGAGNQGG